MTDTACALQWKELYELEVVKKARAWNRMRDADTIAGLNRRLIYGGYTGLIRDADRAYEDTIGRAADAIAAQREALQIVIVAGPSSSGKTTTTIKLCEGLRRRGVSLQMLSLDNYFWDLANQPRDALGDYNFETPEALDCATINGNLTALIGGKKASVPVYNFKTGRREKKRLAMQLEERQLLVIEGLHAFHRGVSEGIPRAVQFRVYIEAICQLCDRTGSYIPWTDIRLLRRMVRDSLHRNYTPVKTVGHWHYVRAAEKKYIVPFIKDAEVVVNGYLAYELPVHKRYLHASLREAVETFSREAGREDAFRRAARCLRYLDEVRVLGDDSIIPPTSLLREFIGGSAYHG
ncbi:MAG: nucleoside kinase [Candidatus Aureabacteria bacterium]|nr:nucleoside kinase [Candidatus Auribacterota bacterium]